MGLQDCRGLEGTFSTLRTFRVVWVEKISRAVKDHCDCEGQKVPSVSRGLVRPYVLRNIETFWAELGPSEL